jgi:hypothetical protein
MHQRILVSGKPDVANFAGLLSRLHSFNRAAVGENSIGILHSNDLMELHQIDTIGLEPLQRFVDL